MSSGQKAWAEEKEEEAFTEHHNRLEALGYMAIAGIADEIRQTLRSLEGDMVVLPRAGWRRIDKLRELANRLG